MKRTRSPVGFLVMLLAAFPSPTVLKAETIMPKRFKSIARSLRPFVDSHTLAGAVTLVASRDGILSLEVVGFADIAAGRPMQKDSLFWIASMSKPMTAAALMMLVDEGKVNVEDPVEKYLPEFRGQMLAVEQDADHVLLRRPARPITVRDILTHTSGLPFGSRVEHHIDAFPLRVAVLTYALTPLKFAPGSKYEYSNAGINTAGRLAKSYKPNAANTGLEETPITQLSYPPRRSAPSVSRRGPLLDGGRRLALLPHDPQWRGP